MELSFIDFIKPELLVLVAVLNVVGAVLKRSGLCKDKYIPPILGALGVVLSFLWVVADMSLVSGREWLFAVFSGAVQGVLCAGAAVYAHQVVKQAGKKE